MDTFTFILEIIGTIAFASSGAMIAIEKKMDIFGVNILGATTAVGGGMMRDIILGVTPPAAFSKPVYVLFSVLTATLLFTIVYTNPSILDSGFKSKYYCSRDAGCRKCYEQRQCLFLCFCRSIDRSRGWCSS